MEADELEYLMLLSKKWFPDRELDEETMGEAHFLEERYWKRMEISVQNAISHAFGS